MIRPLPIFCILFTTCSVLANFAIPLNKGDTKKEIISGGLAIVLAGAVAPAWAQFESDRTLSEKAIVRMIDAIKTAEQAKPGETVEVNMGRDDGWVVYKIEIVDGKNTHNVYVDAVSGKIHVIK